MTRKIEHERPKSPNLDSQKAEYFETDDFSEMRLVGTKMRNEL